MKRYARLRDIARVVVRIVLGAAVGATIALVGISRLPNHLTVRTDIVGYPIFNGYNSPNLLNGYIILVVACLTGLATAVLLPWPIKLLRLEGGFSPQPLPDRAAVVRELGLDRGAAVARRLFLSGVIGLEVAVGVFGTPSRIVIAALLGAIAVFLSATVAERVADNWASARFGDGTSESLVAIALAISTLVGLAITAFGSEVVIAGGGSRSVNWFPPSIAVPVLAIGITWLAVRLRRCHDPAHLVELARRATVAFALPALVVVLTGQISGAREADAFHSGEFVVPAEWIPRGLVPWRDVLTIHGFGQDGLFAWIGMHVIENSLWGTSVGIDAIVLPLFFALTFVLISRITQRNWVVVGVSAILVTRYATGTQVSFDSRGDTVWWRALPNIAFSPPERFILIPLALLLLHAAIRTSNPRRWIGLTVALFIQAVFFPEALIFVAVVGGVVVLWCIQVWRTGGPRPFAPLLWCAICGAALSAAFAVYLWIVGAFGDFIGYYRTFASGHQLTGSFPLDYAGSSGTLTLARVLALVLVAICAVYLAIRARVSALDPADWVAMALAAFTLAYYPKYLARADGGHALEASVAVLPLMAYLVHRLLDPAERALLRRSWARHVARYCTTRLLTLPLAVTVLLAIGLKPIQAVDGFAQRFHRTVPAAAESDRIGYATGPPHLRAEAIDDVRTVLDAAVPAGGSVFDFTNSPLLFNYFLDRRPANRYFNVSMAIREADQRDLVKDLAANPPSVVAWSSEYTGLPVWDGITNEVRHYDVADWILDHYEPYAAVDGYGLWVPIGHAKDLPAPAALDLHSPASTADLYARGPACEWGLSPRYFAPKPSRQELKGSVPLSPRPLDGLRLSGWASTSDGTPASRVVAFADDAVVGTARPGDSRPDVAIPPDHTANEFRGYGFQMILPYAKARSVDDLTVMATDATGAASLLSGPEVADSVLTAAGLHRAAAPLRGNVERREVGRLLEMPLPARAAQANWLHVTVPNTSERGDVLLTGDPTQASGIVSFEVAPSGTQNLFIRVGACSQWRALTDELLVWMPAGVSTMGLKLVP